MWPGNRLKAQKYEEGVSPQVEYLDSQTTLTNAAINEVISEYDYYITYADFERIVALYEF
jgi:outer membrane protein TolC